MVADGTSLNDYSRLGAVTQDTTHDYTQIKKDCENTDNWFLRARGLWDEERKARRQ